MPQSAAGWRTEPPVSEPRASGARPAATAAADPPEEPPGTRVGSQGLRVGPKAEFSVEEPKANSSRLVFPRITAPAARRRAVTVASPGARNPWRIRDAQVVGWPAAWRLSLRATGTPSRGRGGAPEARRASTARAAARAP